MLNHWWEVTVMLKHLKNGFLTLMNDEEGATAIEYALIAAVISLGLLAALTPVRTALIALFAQIAATLTPSTGGG